MSSTLKQDADDMCMICFTEALACAPAIQLVCGHVFHVHCTRNVLTTRWPGPRITFSFSQCPICKSPIEHPVLSELLKPIKELYEDVRRKALMRLEYEGLHRAVAITSPGAKFYNDPTAYAMDRYAYYVCFKCNKVIIFSPPAGLTFEIIFYCQSLPTGLLRRRGAMRRGDELRLRPVRARLWRLQRRCPRSNVSQTWHRLP